MSSLIPDFVSRLVTKDIRVRENSTVWIRPDQIERIVKRNCPGDVGIAQMMMDDWNDDVVYTVRFYYHTRVTGKFYIIVGGREISVFDHEVIRSEL
tara:strand:- start:602 stop:889 length:288 start_codon:yes stop_codon:yes gene_type:complete